eukprot:11381913-Karenia_brevis.AAC.1
MSSVTSWVSRVTHSQERHPLINSGGASSPRCSELKMAEPLRALFKSGCVRLQFIALERPEV